MRMKPAPTLDDAKKMLAAAEDEARRGNWEVVVAILNDGGRPSAVWERRRWIEGRHRAYATFLFIAAQGGLPIIVDGDLIGAIGVSGVKSAEDEQIAMAAVLAVFPQAKTARAGEENDAQDF
jgi:glc operon protein GlcG